MTKSLRTWLAIICTLLNLGQSLYAQSDEEIAATNQQIDTYLEKAHASANKDESSGYAKKALDLAKSLDFKGAAIKCLMILGKNAHVSKKPMEALRHYLEAGALASAIADQNAQKEINLGLGQLYTQVQMFDNAIEAYQQALILDPNNETLVAAIGDAYLGSKLYDSVDVYYNLLIDKYQKRGDYSSEIKYYRKLIDSYSAEGNHSMALAYYLRIENVLSRSGTPSERALLYNNLGRQYLKQQLYAKALEYFKKAELQCAYLNCPATDVLLVNTGVCLFNIGQTNESIQYFLKAIEILQAKKDYGSLAHAEELLSGAYLNTNDLYNARKHNKLGQTYAELARDSEARSRAYERAADIHFELYEYEDAIYFYKLFLALNDSLRSEDKLQVQKVSELKTQLERAEIEERTRLHEREIEAITIKQNELEKQRLEAINLTLSLESKSKEDALKRSEERQKLTDSEFKIKSLEALKAQQDLRLAAQQNEALRNAKQIEDLQKAEELERERQLANEAKQKQELALLQRDNEIGALTLKENETFRRYALLAAGLFSVIMALLAAGYLYSRRSNSRLNAQNKAIELQKSQIDAERQRSDTLLRNILPLEVAEELKQTGLATPKVFENVSVLFTDFESFTKLTERIQPELVLEELNTCFHAFDQICEKHQLEKIKTIGDAFMAAAGVPVSVNESAKKAALAGLEMLDYLENRAKQDPKSILRRMRVGIHSGQVVAGVVGKNKFAYDIWGDTVNTAARMEEFGEAGRVNVSEATAQLLNDAFLLEDRGYLNVHSKGELRMYFVKHSAKSKT
jgi:adenylate cyclase